jgi:3'(2'), 5'-bisphosphate nucleotidase
VFFDKEQLKQIMDIAKNAGDEIIKNYQKNTKFTTKKDGTPLTDVDLISHNIIANGLKNLTPNINILSEEGGILDFKERQKWSEYWLIDPLDGTRGFIDKTDDFCVCVSYIKNNYPVFGLIYAPISQTYYLANDANNAYKIKNNNWQKITVSKPQSQLRVITGRYTNQKKIKQHIFDKFGDIDYKISNIGSALKFCFIAEGKYDYYPALGVCSEWDTAAGGFILRSSSGYLADFYNNNLKYNTKSDLISPKFFASGELKNLKIT